LLSKYTIALLDPAALVLPFLTPPRAGGIGALNPIGQD
jgi:hypothetical protein